MTADLRARLARAWDTADDDAAVLELLADGPCPPGFAMWRLGRSAVVLPALVPTAPTAVRERYHLRIVANATGRCPECSAVAGASKVRHLDGCPAVFTEEDREWFDPRAVAR